jgi:hypothetical protein
MAKPSQEEQIRDIRRAYVIARALNIQYQWIREFLNPELVKVVNNAKAANSYFIKQIDDAFIKKHVDRNLIPEEEELAFKLLEELEKTKPKE